MPIHSSIPAKVLQTHLFSLPFSQLSIVLALLLSIGQSEGTEHAHPFWEGVIRKFCVGSSKVIEI